MVETTHRQGPENGLPDAKSVMTTGVQMAYIYCSNILLTYFGSGIWNEYESKAW